jgi:hypothetical protein
MHITLDMAFFGCFALLTFTITVVHRAHSIRPLHKKGTVTASYWGTYGEPTKETKKAEVKGKSHFPKITPTGRLSLPAASNQNTTCIAGKVAARGK